MSALGRALNPYFSQTSSLTYSYLIALPLLIMYEVFILISQPEAGGFVRLSTDIWIKWIFAGLGFDTLKFTVALALILGLIVFFKERENPVKIRGRFFLYMILESTLYAIVIAMLISGFLGLIFNADAEGITGLTKFQQLALSIGAGLYEELIFRVLLVNGLIIIFGWMSFSKGWKHAGAMILAALIFSAVHYFGSYGDQFTLSSFMFRFLFGLALNGLLIFRGFGIAAWTHSMYDVIVVIVT
ncbi:MAG TPA: CPBP family intramembrane metalloprotease [Bacteroidetes bacterium]|nr:CPBP family intramembrane metalloprotease [Bacteroidota bacterium]